MQSALKTPEPRIHDYGEEGNIHKRVNLEFGNVDEALAGAHHVREDLFFYEGNTHLPLEQHASLAEWHPDGKITLWSSTQTPHYVHRALAKVLELPPSRVRVVAIPNGGGFGGKSDIFNHEIVVAKLAMITGRPVKICLTREEVSTATAAAIRCLCASTGVDANGCILGMHSQTYIDGGAYGSYGVASTFYTGALRGHLPRRPLSSIPVRCFTNKPPCGPKRGHGTPQPRFGVEIQLDKIAEDLNLDPVEIRKQNLVPPHSMTANWLRVGSMGLGPCIDKVVEGSDWYNKFRKLPYGKGVGIACGSYLSGAGLPIYWNDAALGVQIKLDRSGGRRGFLRRDRHRPGIGLRCSRFVVADVLGIDPVDIRVVCGDSGPDAVDLGSYRSRVTPW
ncbi:MAG: molybdopterin-dependent oxidoreductase [Blastocatellia bacterium]|nr:molybdopterin-dependent oxidoreductase [Blastocatellia bacterium]